MLMPEHRAKKYRLIATEIRNAARGVAMEESRSSLINLASAYERMATLAEAAVEPPPATDSVPATGELTRP